jgi:hypothetical protein
MFSKQGKQTNNSALDEALILLTFNNNLLRLLGSVYKSKFEFYVPALEIHLYLFTRKEINCIRKYHGFQCHVKYYITYYTT